MEAIIFILGESDSGTAMHGKKLCNLLCKELGYRCVDTDDSFRGTITTAHTTERTKCKHIRLVREDCESIPLFPLAFRLVTDAGLRGEHLDESKLHKGKWDEKESYQRDWEKSGSSIEQERDGRQQHLQCHQVILNCADGLEVNLQIIKESITSAECLERIEVSVRELFAKDASGHDYWHSIRVFRNACKISMTEECDWEVVALAALLHDADDRKLFRTENCANARRIMKACGVAVKVQEKVIHTISMVSFQGRDTKRPDTMEGKIVQDADRLDAIGALGIARVFAYGGSCGRSIYDPQVPPRMDLSEQGYKSYRGTSVNHFYEKLFLLKGLMNTAAAKKIAEKRDGYMKDFMDEFLGEWSGMR